jgi:thiol-disulfide isomerase/thioredoxin
MTASGPAANLPPHCNAEAAGGVLLPSKSIRPAITRRSAIAAATGLAASACAGNYARAQLDGMPPAADAIRRSRPAPAPNLTFVDQGGRKLSLANYRGSGLVVNVWATWCGPCVAEFPTLAALAPRLAGAGILVLPISIDADGLKPVQQFYASHSVRNLPILLDPNGNSPNTLNAPGIPVTIIVNPAGQLVGRTDGAADWNNARTIDLLTRLAGRTPAAMPTQAQSGFQPI